MLMTTRTAPVRPFLKWAGNKYRLIERLKARLPAGRRLVEPFTGSGAVFLNTDYPRYLLADGNKDLIDLYNILKREGAAFIADCRKLFRPANNTAEAYYKLRAEFNACNDTRRRAALFVYLNRHGYNGLCRYNAKGGFNVPFGRYKKPYFPEQEMLAFHHKARRATFRHATFEQTLRQIRRGDVVYCDPPYVPLSLSSSFTAYHADGFNLEQQQRLADIAAQAAGDGISVLISNHDTPFTRSAYAAADIEQLSVQRSISCHGHKRRRVNELLAFYPAAG
ncbi:MAG: adenine-specific DNA-methyltransferase [Thiohalomonadaceae bacterium]